MSTEDPKPAYAELHCHSALSLLDGASTPEALATRAAELGYPALAITDHDEMGGIVRFGVACEEANIAGILGAELTVDVPDTNSGTRRTHLVLLAETREGYRNISSLVTRARMDTSRGEPSVPWSLVATHARGVTALTGCPRGWIPQLIAEGRDDDAWRTASAMREVFDDHLAIECWDHRLPEERALVRKLRPLAQKLGVPWVVTNNVHYAHPDARIVHDVLTALRHERTLDEMGTRLRPNAEWALKDPALILKRWRGAEEGVHATLDIAARCEFRLGQLKPAMPAFPLPPGVTADEYLERLVEQGAFERWGDKRTPRHDAQLAHELGMISKLNLAGYFLTVWDIVRFARREGILCQGRGSAANSAVCYCLGITAIDPIRMELLFERFLTEERQEPPDIDIDFAHRDRERVLQYVYDRYGREHAAMVCEQITWRGRSAVRDAARVLGFSVQQGDILSSLSDRFSAKATAAALRVDDTPAQDTVVKSNGSRRLTSRDRPAPRAAYEPYGSPNAQRRPDAFIDARNSVWEQTRLAEREKEARAAEMRRRAAVEEAKRAGRPVSQRESAGETFAPSRDPRHFEPAYETHEDGRNRTTGTRETSSGRELLQRAGLDPDDKRVQMLANIVDGLHQLPRHRSIHVGGFILSEEPLGSIVPIEPASMPDRTVVQWEKDDLDPVGLVKIDLLGLGMLTVVQDCLAYIRHTRGVNIDLGQLDMTDQAVYDDLCRADTVGLFQVESRAQMNTLPRLKPRCFYDLVVEVALIRPGPIQGEMVHPYLRRRAGEEPVTYPHPLLEPVLARTMGVPLFQEQGMQVAITAAGFTPSQADQLRRAMGHKRSRERMAAICEELIAGMERNGIPEETGRRIYNQINAFADYGFPESHAASFALIVYATAFLRHYYAPEYLAAILNAQPMGFYAPGTLVEDAIRHGVEVRPVDLTRSSWDHTLEMRDGRALVPKDGVVKWGRSFEPAPVKGKNPVAVRIGVRLVKGLGAKARRALEEALDDGPFTSVEDAVRRVKLDRAAWRRLAEAGAFDSMFAHQPPERRRRVALWEVIAATKQPMLPLAPVSSSPVPAHLPSLAPVELTEADYRMTGVSLGGHPMKHLRELLAPNGVLTAEQLRNTKDGQKVAVAGLVICRQRPGTAKGFVFLTLEDETGMVNIVITPQRFEKDALMISTSPLLLVRGTLQIEQSVVNVRGEKFRPLELGGGEKHVPGRNFR